MPRPGYSRRPPWTEDYEGLEWHGPWLARQWESRRNDPGQRMRRLIVPVVISLIV